MAIFPKVIYRFNTVPVKMPNAPPPFFAENSQPDLNIHLKMQGTQNNQNNLEKDGRFNLSVFKTCYKATVIKTVWYWHKNTI